MFGIGGPEIIVILVIVVVLFGGSKLPELGKSAGEAIKSFRKGVEDIEKSGKDIVDDMPGVKEVAEIKEQVDKVKDLGKITKIIK